MHGGRRRPHIQRVVAVALAAGTGACPGQAEPDEPQDLSAARKALAEREAAREEASEAVDTLDAELRQQQARLATLRQKRIQAAEAVQTREAQLTRLEKRLETVRAQAEAAREALVQRRDNLQQLLMALQRLARTPEAGLLAAPEGPLATVRGAQLLQAALPQVRERADRLAAELEDLATINAQLAERRRAVERKRADLAAKRSELADLTEQQQSLVRQTAAKQQRLREKAAKAAQEAEDLAALIDRFERAQRRQTAQRTADLHAAYRRQQANALEPLRVPVAPPEPRYTQDPRQDLRAPVAGNVALGYGETDDYGTESDGVTYRARDEAQVIAPLDGQVIFVGPFEGYGKILILENGGGYTTVLGGLEQVDVTVDDYVLGGEPIARAQSGDQGGSRVYLELRAEGEPIDPRPETKTQASLD